MLNYIYADFYRIFNKKSFYAFLAICSLGFITVVFIANTRSFTVEVYAMMVQVLLTLAPLFIGSFVFNSVYTDDLRSKSLQTAIGFGKKRSVIVAVKFVDAMLLMGLFSLLMYAHIAIAPLALGFNVPSVLQKAFITDSIACLLQTVGFFAITSVAVYFYQKTTAATTVYLLLATGTISNLMGLILGQSFIVNLVGDLKPYLYSNIITNLQIWFQTGSGNIGLIVLQIGMYIIGGSALAALAFKHKELEF